MFAFVRRNIPYPAVAANYLSRGPNFALRPTSFKNNPIGKTVGYLGGIARYKENEDTADQAREDVDKLAKQQAATDKNVQHLEQKVENIAGPIKADIMAEIKDDVKTDLKNAIDLAVKAKMVDIDHLIDSRWEEREGGGMARLRTNLGKQPVGVQRSHQQEKQQLERNLKACLARIAQLEEEITKKADKTQVDKQRREFASFGPRISQADRIEEQTARLETQYNDLSSKVDSLGLNQGALRTAIQANEQTERELRGRVHVLEAPLPVRQVNITNLGAVATTIAAAEQHQPNTGGGDPQEVSALAAKTEGHDHRIGRLEAAVGGMEPDKMRECFQWAEWKFDMWEKCIEQDFPEKVREIEAAHERQLQLHRAAADEAMAKQKQSFEQQLRQQKEASDKELSDYKESLQENMRLYEASVRKEYEEHKASKDKELAAYVARTDAEQKAQNERHDNLSSIVSGLVAQLQGQQPAPGVRAPQPSLPPLGNGPWGSAPGQGQQPAPEVQLWGVAQDNDHEMMDAPAQPPKTQQQPPIQPPHHQPAPANTATLRDTLMAFGGPAPVQKAQPVGGSKPLPTPQAPVAAAAPAQGARQNPVASKPAATGTGPSKPAPSAPATPAPRRGSELQRSIFAPGASGSKMLPGQQPLPAAMATPARAPKPSAPKTPAPKPFDFSAPLPPVNKPQVDWSASSMGKLDFDPPAGLDGDEDAKPSPSKARVPPTNAAPATPSAGQPAANKATLGNDGASTAVKTNGPSSAAAAGPPSTPAKPQAPTPAKSSTPKPAKKKVDAFIKRKPAAAPGKPAEVTNKTRTTATAASSLAQRKQEIFAQEFSNTMTPTPMTPAPPAPVAPMAPMAPMHTASPFGLPPGSRIPGLTYTEDPATPASKPGASPLAKRAATSGTIMSPTTTNIFLKEVAEKPSASSGNPGPEGAEGAAGDAEAVAAEPPATPAGDADDTQMSDPDGEPEETAGAPEPEANPQKREAEAPVVAKQENDAMDTDRIIHKKPVGRAKNLTEAQIKSHKARFEQESAWSEMEKALAHEAKAKANAPSAEDDVDYADPDDINDEDVFTTTMIPPTPNVRPTKYSVQFFLDWRRHFLSRDNLVQNAAEFDLTEEEPVKLFVDQVRELEEGTSLDDLLLLTGFPITKKEFTRWEMGTLLYKYREEVYFDALREISVDEIENSMMTSTRRRFEDGIASWFDSHPPDVV